MAFPQSKTICFSWAVAVPDGATRINYNRNRSVKDLLIVRGNRVMIGATGPRRRPIRFDGNSTDPLDLMAETGAVI